MSWNKSDKIALAAVVVSLCSAGFSAYSYWDQTAEKVGISVDTSEFDYVHAYVIRKDKKYDSYVSHVARWYKIQFANNSRKTISISEISFGDNKKSHGVIDRPLFEKLSISEKTVKIGHPIEFPIKLESGEVVKGFVLLPVSVFPRYGKILLEEFRKPNNPIDTSIERIIYDPGYLANYERTSEQELNNSSIGKLGIKAEVEIQGLDLKRPLFQELADGIYQFGDNTLEHDFGFIHHVDSYVMSRALDKIIENPNLDIDVTSPVNLEYQMKITIGSGSVYSIALKSGSNALDPLTSKE